MAYRPGRFNRRFSAIPTSACSGAERAMAAFTSLLASIPLLQLPVLQLGLLDGKEGFIFHFLHAFWYRLLVDINLDEILGKPRRSKEDGILVAFLIRLAGLPTLGDGTR